jgi:acyl-CoA reductase-like NAD-dependent aldehyde dehydrogenase
MRCPGRLGSHTGTGTTPTILNRTYQPIIDRRDEFSRLIVDETGKPWTEAQTEVA